LNDDRPLLITGETEVGENQVKIICQDIVSLEAAKQKAIKSILIPVSKERLSHSRLMKLRDLIFRHPGECRLKFRIDIDQDNSTTVIAHNRYNVMPEENLLQEMSSLVGGKLMYDV
jgi:DNA polymerase-3 subunit alpha